MFFFNNRSLIALPLLHPLIVLICLYLANQPMDGLMVQKSLMELGGMKGESSDFIT